jgi:hypothetical protein
MWVVWELWGEVVVVVALGEGWRGGCKRVMMELLERKV